MTKMPFLQNLKLISAGAGSGKTYRLTLEMADLLTAGKARPEGIIATTFTKRAAAELKERVRVKLLREGMTREAGELSNALIGTVHGLGVKLLRRFAFEAGVSPQVDIIAEGDHQRLFNLSMAAVISLDRIREIEALIFRLDLNQSGKYNWRGEVLGLVEVIRANNFGPEDIEASKRKSWESLRAYLPEERRDLTLEQYRNRVMRVLGETEAALLDNAADQTKKTDGGALLLRNLLRDLRNQGDVPWSAYAKLGDMEAKVGAKSRDLVGDISELGRQHASLGAFQDDLRRYQELLFDCARAAIEEYDTYKKRRGRIDYTDMEVLVLKLLDNPGVAETLERELDLLMVDEFQDTSPIQLAIFLRLSRLARQSVWVGDPKQSIYGFRGAEPRLMAAVMRANGPLDAANIQTQSWRSREDIVYACNSLFVAAFPEYSPEEVALEPVRLRTGSRFSPAESPELAATGGLIHWHFTPSEGRYNAAFMLNSLVKAIGELLANPPLIVPKGEKEERRLRAGDIAVLCRTNTGCGDLAAELTRQGIPAAIARKGLLATAEATLLLAALKFLLNGDDNLSVAEMLLFGERRTLTEIIDDRLEHLARRPAAAWGDGAALLEKLDVLREETAEHSTSEMINLVLERTDLRRIAVAWGDGQQRLANIDELRRLAVEYEDNCHRQHRAASLGGYLLYLDQLLRTGQDMQGASERPEAVNVLTYHRSKGLEWPAVICFNLDQGLRADVWGRAVVPDDPAAPVDLSRPLADRWIRYWVNPYGRQSRGIAWLDALDASPEQDAARAAGRAEEARLLYVGATRARDYLILPTGSRDGAAWVDRVYARGGHETTVLAPETVETPFTWKDRDIDKTYRSWTEPPGQPAGQIIHRPLPFLAPDRPGRVAHAGRTVTEDWLLAYYGESVLGGVYSYATVPEPEPATDPRLLGRCLSAFLAGDPGGAADPHHRRDLAAGLLADWQPGGDVATELFTDVSNGFHDFLSENWPDASHRQHVHLRGTVDHREGEGVISRLMTLADGSSVLLLDVAGGTKQLTSALGLRAAELRWLADLYRRQQPTPVAAAFLNVPLLGQIIEVTL